MMGALERMGFGRSAPSQTAAESPRAMIDQVQLGSLTDPGVAEFLRGAGGGESASGVVVSPEAALRTGTVFRCVTLISGAVATLPLDLKRRVDARSRVDAEDHPAWAVLRRRPNGWQTPSQFRRYMQACVLLRGRAFAQIVRGVGKRIIALHPLHPDRMEIKQSPTDLTLTFRYTRPDGAVVTFPQREIFYLCGLTLDGVNGLSVLGYARESVGEAIATARHSASLFKNGTTIGGVLTAKDRLTPEGVEALRASLEAYRGADNAHKNLILQNGMTYDRLGLTLADAQFIQNREFSQYETCMFFGVPPHMLGLTAKTTSFGAGLENMGRGFVAYTLQDWFTTWTEAVERDLTADQPDVYARFNTNALVRGDIKARYGAYAVGRQWGWLSANDVRAFEDEDAIEGGDAYLNPLNMKAADEAGQTPDPDPEDLNDAPEE
jgi:HK97 family phage portal protein